MKYKGAKKIIYIIFTVISCLLAVGINVYIIVHSCLDAQASTEASAGVIETTEQIVNTISPGTVTPENHESFAAFIRKAFGHFGLFVISGLLTSIALYLSLKDIKKMKPHLLFVISLFFGLSMGAITETIQMHVPGRSGEFSDVLIDFSGYILGMLIIGLILFLIIRHIRKKEEKKLDDANIEHSNNEIVTSDN